MGGDRGGPRRRRDSADEHGCRRDEKRLRPRPDQTHLQRGGDSCYRFRWSRQPRASLRRTDRGRRQRGPRRFDLSFSRSDSCPGEVVSPGARSRGPMNGVLQEAKFNADGLIPAIVQDARTREILTLAYMNKEALELTIERGETYFWSRSRQKLWHKGETSGNSQKVVNIRLDCDNDAVLVEVEPTGPACHTGSYSCFLVEPELEGVLKDLYSVIEERKEKRPEGSYTTYLFNSGLDKILKKVGEECTETIVAAKNADSQRLVSETGDLIYHLLVLLVERGVTLDEIGRELRTRRNSSPKLG